MLHQILFNVEVEQTLKLVHHKLGHCEDDMSMNLINECSHFMPSNIEEVESHIYGTFYTKMGLVDFIL